MMFKSILTQLAWTASMKLSTIIKENNVEKLDDYRKMQHKYIFIFIFPLWDLAWDTCKHWPGFEGGVYLKGNKMQMSLFDLQKQIHRKIGLLPLISALWMTPSYLVCWFSSRQCIFRFSVSQIFSIRHECLAVILLFVTTVHHIQFITFLSEMKACK